MSALREACERGVVIVAITQCAKGSVSNAYETGRTLLQAGVVPGGDMTPEVRTPFLVVRSPRDNTAKSTDGAFRLVVCTDKAQLPPVQARTLRRGRAQTRRRTIARRADEYTTWHTYDHYRCEL